MGVIESWGIKWENYLNEIVNYSSNLRSLIPKSPYIFFNSDVPLFMSPSMELVAGANMLTNFRQHQDQPAEARRVNAN